jgi:CheY-like chemotaxis protein
MKAKFDSKPTIFLADDDPDDREMLVYAFRQVTDKHHIRVFDSGRALINLLSRLNDRELPCLIVLDFNMPEYSGKDVLTYLQKIIRYRKIPKVIYSTSNSYVDKSASFFVGACDFITKSTTVNGILNSAKKMLTYCNDSVAVPS